MKHGKVLVYYEGLPPNNVFNMMSFKITRQIQNIFSPLTQSFEPSKSAVW